MCIYNISLYIVDKYFLFIITDIETSIYAKASNLSVNQFCVNAIQQQIASY